METTATKYYVVTYTVWEKDGRAFWWRQVDGGMETFEARDTRAVKKAAREQLATRYDRRVKIEIDEVEKLNG